MSASVDTMARPGLIGSWIAAIRPATLTASAAPVAVGTALAIADGAFHPLAAALAFVGAALLQIGTNLYNDLSDFKKGADTEERLGPARAVQRGWLSQNEVATGTAVTFVAAALTGIYLVVLGGWPIAAIGVSGIVSGLAYTGGPKPLAYTGLGDLFVLAFFGLAAVCGTYFLQVGTVTWPVVAASVSVGALATAILVVNNLRDRFTDVKANKRTLAVRFGGTFARAEYVALVFAAYAVVIGVAIVLQTPGWLAPLLTLPIAARCVSAVLRTDGADLNPWLGNTAKLGLAFSLALSIGVAW
ncbi:MAG: 1,4-dihydroxy-2-naphthoate octaprenyltransferase [Myxococcota bacterium]|jgi:1,4-dihydroxy-2-naphthoate octaprenyltransferase